MYLCKKVKFSLRTTLANVNKSVDTYRLKQFLKDVPSKKIFREFENMKKDNLQSWQDP